MSSYHRVKANKYTEHFRTLELPEDSSKVSFPGLYPVIFLDGFPKGHVRKKYIDLVKKFHPDTYKDNGEKFNQIDLSYRTLIKKFQEDKDRDESLVGEYGSNYDKEKMEKMEEQEEDEIDHSVLQHVAPAPQHRQYLENPFGYGSPAQRQKQNQKFRALKANEAVYEHRMGKLTVQYEDRIATRERATVKKQQTRNEIERLVEDLIVESMASGDFDNLAGKGQPIPNRADYNPYTDFTTHKMNQIMVETGFAPEWVQLQKDIRVTTERIREEMKVTRQKIGPAPINREQYAVWQKLCERLRKEDVSELNRMIEKFNLIVPIMNHQRFIFKLNSEAEKIFNTGYDPDNTQEDGQTVEKEEKPTNTSTSNMFSGLFNIFK